MNANNVNGIINGDPIRRLSDGRLGHVTGVWNSQCIQVLWEGPGPEVHRSGAYDAEDVARRITRGADGIWEVR